MLPDARFLLSSDHGEVVLSTDDSKGKDNGGVPPAKPITPLPIGALAAIGIALFTNSLIITVLFPFTPLIVEYFEVTTDEADVGWVHARTGISF